MHLMGNEPLRLINMVRILILTVRVNGGKPLRLIGMMGILLSIIRVNGGKPLLTDQNDENSPIDNQI